jgi:predicted metal-binding membrane protein
MVWVAASAAFAGVGVLVQSRAGAPVTGYAAIAALGIAGLYQFSGLKDACLKKCRNPFAVLFSRWSNRPLRILRLGAEQGVWCLGCCWALMLVMFAVGTMNIFWVALVGLFTVVEKQTSGTLATRLAGAILLVWATALLLASFALKA